MSSCMGWTCVPLCLTLAVHALGQDPMAGVDKGKLEEFKRTALEKEDEGQWKKIDWRKDMDAALKEAREKSKPLLAVLIVGHLAKKDAAEC